MEYINSFFVGGFICLIGQILIDKTSITPGKILVFFVCIGCILGGLGIYEEIAKFGYAGATVPLPGFGYALAKGVMEEVDSAGFLGIFTGGLKATSGGISAAIIFSFFVALLFEPKGK